MCSSDLAAWLIAQHAIGEPAFMRECRDLLAAAAAAGAAPAWQLAYLDDRIRVFEDKPQRYGTQLREGADGRPEPCPLEDAAHVEAWRADVGLPPLADALAKAVPDRVPAGHFGLMGGGGVFFAQDPKSKKRYVVMAAGGGGWGGRPFEIGRAHV